jgi:hypothetical protein
MRWNLVLSSAVIVSAFAANGCRSPTDEGASGFWARVQGVVREADGQVRADARVSVSRCDGSHSFVGQTNTAADGSYDLWARIPAPPQYPPPIVPDTASCEVFARYLTRVGTDSVRLVFKRNRDQVAPVIVDLVLKRI